MVSEQDLEQLEMLLDGEMDEAQANALRQRLSSDATLTLALDRLRTQRELRRQAWQLMEPREADVLPVVRTVQGAIRREQVLSQRLRTLRYATSLAACIMLGFLFGRFIPYGPETMTRDRGTGIIFDAGRGPVMEVGDNAPSANRATGYKVLLTDNLGRLIAEQRFDTYDEAREFTDDLSRLQNRSRPMRVSDTILTKDQF